MAKRIIPIALLAAMLPCGNLSMAMPKAKIVKKQPPSGTVMRSIFHAPFVPTGSLGSLDILCLADMGTVSVVVQDELGSVVYEEENVMTYASSIWSISVDGWELGCYTLSIIPINGVMYEWEFELEEEE